MKKLQMPLYVLHLHVHLIGIIVISYKLSSFKVITFNKFSTFYQEQMEELTSQLSEHELDEPGPQDIYSKVMGNEKNGTAGMYGLGVRASDVWGVVPSRSARQRDKLQWKSTAERLSAELAQYKAREAQRQGSSDNDSHGQNVPHTSPQGLIANEPRPLRVCVYLNENFVLLVIKP